MNDKNMIFSISNHYREIAIKCSVLLARLVPFERSQNFISCVNQSMILDTLLLKGHFTKLALMGLRDIGRT